MNRPDLSITMPTKDRPELLSRALASVATAVAPVADQVELTVSDGSSDDASARVVEGFLADWPGRHRYVRNRPPLPLVENMNRAVELATGDWVVQLHDDDYLLPGAGVALLEATGRAQPEEAVCLFGVDIVDAQGVRRRSQRFRRQDYLEPARALERLLRNSSFVRTPALMVRRAVLEREGLFDPGVGGATDVDMWVRLFARYGVRCLPPVTCAYTIHEAAATSGMWNPATVAAIGRIFDRAAAYRVVPEATLRRWQADFLHQFVLAGVWRRLRMGRRAQAREVLALFELPEVRALGTSPRWLPARLAFTGATAGAGRRAARDGEPRVLWVAFDHTAPHPALVECSRRAGLAVRELFWAVPHDGQRPFGRFVEFGGRPGREQPMSAKLVSPRMLLTFARAPEDVLVTYELGLIGLYAGLSKLVRPHKVVSLIEGDYRNIGRTGTVALKVAVRRLAARLVDVFVANSAPAREYLIQTLDVPEGKIVVGWWLAGLPATLASRPPRPVAERDGGPLFVCAGRLIPLKGIDLLLHALAVYRGDLGPCTLWVVGDGPERDALVELARRLGVEDHVKFLGTVDHAVLKGAFEACHALVFPTLQDLVGRVVVEALTAGAPVVISPMSGAAGTIVHDGVNGIVVDPRDPGALAAAMRRAADPATSRALRDGVRRTNAALRPEAAAEVILGAVAAARNGAGARARPLRQG